MTLRFTRQLHAGRAHPGAVPQPRRDQPAHQGRPRHGHRQRPDPLRHPVAVELAASRPAGRRGIAHLRVQQAEVLQAILCGDRDLPAATVAADRLRRRAITCLWLTLADAARVCNEGETGLRRAMAVGRLNSSIDRQGQDLIFAADLRGAGLLAELSRPHGLAVGTAAAIIKLLGSAIDRGRDLGRPSWAATRRCKPWSR